MRKLDNKGFTVVELTLSFIFVFTIAFSMYELLFNYRVRQNEESIKSQMMDYKNEVSTRMIIQKAWELNKSVYVPKVNGQEMTFHPIRSFLELEEGYRGIPEPTSNPVNIINPGLVIIPGVAFDRNLNRVGYGKGYYDRFLSHNDNLRTLAICFELQLEEKIPSDSFDIRPEVLITERHVYVKKIT